MEVGYARDITAMYFVCTDKLCGGKFYFSRTVFYLSLSLPLPPLHSNKAHIDLRLHYFQRSIQ